MNRNATCGMSSASQHGREHIFSAMLSSLATVVPAQLTRLRRPDTGKNTAEKTMERRFASIAADDTNSRLRPMSPRLCSSGWKCGSTRLPKSGPRSQTTIRHRSSLSWSGCGVDVLLPAQAARCGNHVIAASLLGFLPRPSRGQCTPLAHAGIAQPVRDHFKPGADRIIGPACIASYQDATDIHVVLLA